MKRSLLLLPLVFSACGAPTAVPPALDVAPDAAVRLEDDGDGWKRLTDNVAGFSMRIPSAVRASCSIEPGVAPLGVYLLPSRWGASSTAIAPELVCNGVHDNIGLGWRIDVTRVEDEEGASAFIREQYGSGCDLGEREEVAPGTYDVQLARYGAWSEGPEGCGVNAHIVIFFAPSSGKIATWNRGQDDRFMAPDGSRTYDGEMQASFRF